MADAQPANGLSEQMTQLDAARNLVLGDAAFYPQIVQGILPIIGANARLELRRWGADFLAETFASPALPAQQKGKLSLQVLQTLNDLLDIPNEDTAVVRSVVQAAASLYPLVFRHIIDHPNDAWVWDKMSAIKHNILRRWDTSPYAVKVCCIKFVQRVVHVQTPGVISDPRRPEQNETSLSIVPRDHPLVPLPSLEAEASGLLDRLLTIFQENSGDAILVNATLNCLSVLVRTRQTIANKILNAILNFNPLKQANSPPTPTLRVNIKSMERTTRALLINVMKRNPNNPLGGRIQQYIDRMAQSRNEIFQEAPKKRGLPTEPVDNSDNAKRMRVGAETPPQSQLKIPPLPPGPNSFDQLFTLTEDKGLTSFDVKQLPLDLVVKITVPVLARVDQSALDQAIAAVQSRYKSLSKKAPPQAPQQPPKGAPAAAAAPAEEEDDYEPEYNPVEVPQDAVAQAEAVSAEAAELQPDIVSLGPFVLPQPPPLSEEEAALLGKGTVERVFEMVKSMEPPSKAEKKQGFGRLAASTLDRDAWLMILMRLATRASAGLETPDSDDPIIKMENGSAALAPTKKGQVIAENIRDMLYRYFLEDFRARINVAISWMNEEWYNDKVQQMHEEKLRQRNIAMKGGDDANEPPVQTPKHYGRWIMKLMDGFFPYLDARDKVLIRFLSEVPELSLPVIEKVKSLAKDPERVNLCVQALHYLVLMRPPTREMCLDALEDLHRTYEEARPMTLKVLAKWRPEFAKPPQQQQDQIQNQAPSDPNMANANANTNVNGIGQASSNGFHQQQQQANATISPATATE
ncbi:hypothetical protein FQN54_003346 [Arachnomyces sp. PD_36]|nr:hypothetical protein FQN54_003346 [Arachnomyces sp. PD_36]